MRRPIRFHLVLTRNRVFVASATIVVGAELTDVSVNVSDDAVAREQAVIALLMAVHNLTDVDQEREDVAKILEGYGATDPSPVKTTRGPEIEAIDFGFDDWLYDE